MILIFVAKIVFRYLVVDTFHVSLCRSIRLLFRRNAIVASSSGKTDTSSYIATWSALKIAKTIDIKSILLHNNKSKTQLTVNWLDTEAWSNLRQMST